MSDSALTGKEHCRVDCPTGNYAYADRGDVVRCEHGAIFMVRVKWIQWHRRYDGPWNFQRLSRLWTPRRYKRALAVIAAGGERSAR